MVFKVLMAAIIFFTGIAFLIVKNVGFSKVRPEMVMKVSQIVTDEALGFALYRRFYPNLKNVQRVFIFADKSEQVKVPIWLEYLGYERAQGTSRSIYVASEIEKEVLPRLSSAKIFQPSDLQRPGLAIFFLPLEWREKIDLKIDEASFLMTHFFISSSEEKEIPVCDKKENYYRIDCARLFYSRAFYRKKLLGTNEYAGMNKIGHNKYILYLYQ